MWSQHDGLGNSNSGSSQQGVSLITASLGVKQHLGVESESKPFVLDKYASAR